MARVSDLKKITNKNKRRKVYRKIIRQPLAALNYYLGNYNDVTWIVGDGRSGTTWLADLINWNGRYRELFEPVHPKFVKQIRDFPFNPYLRPDDHNSPIGEFLKLVFSGRFMHLRSDVSFKGDIKLKLLYEGLLVKDIFSNLLIGWVHNNMPSVKKIMIVRNPFSVALSKQRYQHWDWMTNPRQFLQQDYLVADYLDPYIDLIQEQNRSFINNQILIWSILHYVPFQQLNKQDVYVLFYEDLFRDPISEISKLSKHFINLEYNKNIEKSLEKLIKKPTRTQGFEYSTLSSSSPLDVWKNELSSKEIDSGIKILEKFGLNTIYGDSSVPEKNSLDILFSNN